MFGFSPWKLNLMRHFPVFRCLFRLSVFLILHVALNGMFTASTFELRPQIFKSIQSYFARQRTETGIRSQKNCVAFFSKGKLLTMTLWFGRSTNRPVPTEFRALQSIGRWKDAWVNLVALRWLVVVVAMMANAQFALIVEFGWPLRQ